MVVFDLIFPLRAKLVPYSKTRNRQLPVWSHTDQRETENIQAEGDL